MGHYSNSDFIERMERRKARQQSGFTLYQPNPIDQMSLKELKEKVIQLTTPNQAMLGRVTAKQVRAAAGTHDLRKWL